MDNLNVLDSLYVSSEYRVAGGADELQDEPPDTHTHIIDDQCKTNAKE